MYMARLKFVLILIMISAAAAFGQPPQSFYKDWKPLDGGRQYDAQHLYVYLDGAAPLFLEAGFAELTVQEYQNDAGAQLLLECFRMTNDTAALSVYLWQPGPPAKHAPLHVPCKINPYQLVFVHKEYFVRIANYSGDSLLLPVMVKLAAELVHTIGPGRKLHLLNKLPKEGRLPLSGRILRGGAALRRFLGHTVTLPLLDTVYAAGAKYKDQNQAIYYRLVLFFPNESAAAGALQTLAKRFDSPVLEKSLKKITINSRGKLNASLKRNLLYLTLYFN